MAASHIAARHFRESEAPACERLGLHRSVDGGKRSIRGELDQMKQTGKLTARHRANVLSTEEMERIIKSSSISPARVIRALPSRIHTQQIQLPRMLQQT